jgi:hypothetical protein
MGSDEQQAQHQGPQVAKDRDEQAGSNEALKSSHIRKCQHRAFAGTIPQYADAVRFCTLSANRQIPMTQRRAMNRSLEISHVLGRSRHKFRHIGMPLLVPAMALLPEEFRERPR